MTKADRQEFSAFVRGDHETQKSFRRYVLGQLGTVRARMRLMILEIDSIRQAVESGAIDCDRALGDLAQLGGLAFLQPAEPPPVEDDNTPFKPWA